MSAFLLYHRSSSPTGRLLAKALGIPYGHLGPGQTSSRIASIRSSLSRSQALIRWGSQQEVPSECRPERTLNSVHALSTASDKLSALLKMSTAGIRTPAFGASAADIVTTATILGRSRRGSCGRDIRVFRPGETPEGCDFYTVYVPNTREYRVHVFQGEVIRVQGKYLDFPGEHKNEFIKNHGQGFRFRAPDRQLNRSRLEASVRAVEALGLDFGAVDLLIGEDGLEYVLEVNTAPACSPLTARAYVERFAEWLGVTPNYEVLNAERFPSPRTGLPGRTPELLGDRALQPRHAFDCALCGYGGRGHRIGCPAA